VKRIRQPTASAYVPWDVIRKHSKSFALASRLLPAAVRADVVVLYAWCRRVDDTVDQAAGAREAEASARRRALELRVARLFSEVEELYAAREPEDPLLRALSRVVRRYGIPRHYPTELVLGMQMDAQGFRYTTLSELLLYCYRVAGVVGLMMCHILGVRSEEALARGAHLGMAMQLSNICRDVAEDFRLGRVYLPEEALPAEARLAPGPGEALPAGLRQAFLPEVRRLLELADAYYRSADAGLLALPFRAALAVAAARRIYAEIGVRVQRLGLHSFTERAYVPALRKLWLVAKAFASTSMLFLRRARQKSVFVPGPLPVKELEDVLCI
jgi:phytoene synthase